MHSVLEDLVDEIREGRDRDEIIEIGLDYHYNKSPREKQLEAFEAQLEIAAQHEMPVVIHSRDAEEDTNCFSRGDLL